MSITDLLTTTILMPTGGSLTELPASNISSDIAVVSKSMFYASGNISKVENTYIKVSGNNEVKIIKLQGIAGFTMTRENTQKRSGGASDYVVNLPGPISYSDVTLVHPFTRDKFFLDWLKNGHMLGGAYRANIEIHVIPIGDKEMVFTLEDAFPVSWNIVKMAASDQPAVLTELVTIAFSKLVFKQQNKTVK